MLIGRTHVRKSKCAHASEAEPAVIRRDRGCAPSTYWTDTRRDERKEEKEVEEEREREEERGRERGLGLADKVVAAHIM